MTRKRGRDELSLGLFGATEEPRPFLEAAAINPAATDTAATVTAAPDAVPARQVPAPPDQAERDAAIDTTKSAIVQAPAGSGKTELLVMRYLALLAVAAEPECILAITFTKLAAAEMRTRILDALDAARDPAATAAAEGARGMIDLARAALANAEQRGWDLRRHPSRLNVDTIDAFSLRIARSMPLASRTGPDFAPVEQPFALYQAAAAATIRALSDAAPSEFQTALRDLLAQHDNDVQKANNLLSSLLRERTFWLGLQRDTAAELDRNVRPQLETLLRQAAQIAMAEIDVAPLPPAVTKKLGVLMQHAARTAELPGIRAWRDSPAMPDWNTAGMKKWKGLAEIFLTADCKKIRESSGGLKAQHGLPTGDDARKDVGPISKEFLAIPGFYAVLKAAADLPQPQYSEADWRLVRSLLIVLRHAQIELQLQFARAAKVDFTETLLAAVEAMRTRTAGEFVPPLEHVLVDEFQDTSLLQHELLALLIERWAADGARTLFLVGDPMQSIYGFRQAEVLLFQKVANAGIARLRPHRRSLQSNFRSQAKLVAAFNGFFEAVFRESKRQETDFAHGHGLQAELEGEPVQWIKGIGLTGKKHTLANREAEAVRICDELQPLWDTRQPKTKIAILVRTSQHAFFILEELRRRGIPYRGVGLEKLGERTEIRDMLALAAALSHPADRIAWMSVLRAPWCGLTMRSLEALAGIGENDRRSGECTLDLLESRLHLLVEGERARAARVLPILRDASALRGRTTFSTLLHNTWHDLGGACVVHPAQAANVYAFLRMVEAREQAGEPHDSESLAAAAEELKAEPDPQAPEQLQVMTIHKAKGLGFDYVFVPGMQFFTRPDNPGLMSWVTPRQPDGGTELFVTAASRISGDASPLLEWVKGERRFRADSELRRLLYVALTRARKRVFLSATIRFKEKKDLGLIQDYNPPTAATLLGVAWCVAKPAFDAFALEQYPAARAAWEAEQAQDSPGPQEVPAEAAFDGSIAAAAEIIPFPAPARRKQNLLRRLPEGFALPMPALLQHAQAAGTVALVEAGADDIREDTSSRIATSQHMDLEARAAGTVAHALLERLPQLMREGPDTVTQWLASSTLRARVLLMQAGVAPARSSAAAQRVQQWLTHAARSPQGMWVFGAKTASADELPIAVAGNGPARNLRVDRTFVAGDSLLKEGSSTRWIIDYKTAAMDGNPKTFLREQEEQYRPALRQYRDAVEALYGSGLPIRAALYFPAAQLLHEVLL